LISAPTSISNLQGELDRLWASWRTGLVADADALMLSEAIEAELHAARMRCRRPADLGRSAKPV
jgi:hypothetical protein